MAEFYDTVNAQRAHRSFTADPVPAAVLRRVLAAATRAPSAQNLQPWRLVAVTDDLGRSQIGDLMRRGLEQYVRPYLGEDAGTPLHRDVARGAAESIAAAPVLVVVAVDPAGIPAGTIDSSIWPAVQNLLLAATAEGLGSALTTIATLYAVELRKIVALPDDHAPVAVIPLGWPERPLGRGTRRSVDEIAHLDRYGTPLTALE